MKEVPTSNLEDYFSGHNMLAMKMKVSEALADTIVPIGEKYQHLLEQEDYLLEIIEKGAKAANLRAEETVMMIRKGLKMLPRSIQ